MGEQMERNLVITDKAYAALGRIQLSELDRLGYKKPYKILASEAILAYAPQNLNSAKSGKGA
jgi:hypothetical protein